MTEKRGSEWPIFLSPWGEAEGSPEEIFPLRLCSGSEWQKKEAQNDPFSCHPEAKPKGLLRRFFPFAYAQGQNDRKKRLRMTHFLVTLRRSRRVSHWWRFFPFAYAQGQNDRIRTLGKGGDSSLRLRSVQNDKIRTSDDVLSEAKEWQKKEGQTLSWAEALSFCEGAAKEWQKRGLRMTLCVTPFFCHPEAKPKGLLFLWRFFPLALAQG